MITYSSRYVMEVVNNYWQNPTITHSFMDEKMFDFYYQEILKIVKLNKDDYILDYGGGNGEIAYRFKKEGFKIKHCDLKPKMIELGEDKYDKILINNVFFIYTQVYIDLFIWIYFQN